MKRIIKKLLCGLLATSFFSKGQTKAVSDVALKASVLAFTVLSFGAVASLPFLLKNAHVDPSEERREGNRKKFQELFKEKIKNFKDKNFVEKCWNILKEISEDDLDRIIQKAQDKNSITSKIKNITGYDHQGWYYTLHDEFDGQKSLPREYEELKKYRNGFECNVIKMSKENKIKQGSHNFRCLKEIINGEIGVSNLGICEVDGGIKFELDFLSDSTLKVIVYKLDNRNFVFIQSSRDSFDSIQLELRENKF